MKGRRDSTAKALHDFAINPPRTSLLGAIGICVQYVVDGISEEQALKSVNRIKKEGDRERARWIVRAFCAYAKARGWSGIQVFRDMVEFYHVSAGVKVPVKPTFVLNEDGKLVPYFVIAWSRMDLSPYQIRILATIIHEAILTLEEFQGSDAVIVCTPVAPYCKKERTVFEWRVSKLETLSDDEKQELFDRYAGAMNDAEKMLIESLG
ncbi:hypothetical protein [Qipengyuania sp. R86523]|uniref:hypothetical protein n=1 Tax=Qipengyuania sp. R86523 TaxID=3093862 RepID=UPI0037CA077D